MYYYNPYFSTVSNAARGGIFRNLFRGINFSSILNGTQRTLNIINQAIPVVKQVSPIVKNSKTIFKLMSEFNKPDEKEVVEPIGIENKETTTNNINNFNSSDEPTFFV